MVVTVGMKCGKWIVERGSIRRKKISIIMLNQKDGSVIAWMQEELGFSGGATMIKHTTKYAKQHYIDQMKYICACI